MNLPVTIAQCKELDENALKSLSGLVMSIPKKNVCSQFPEIYQLTLGFYW